MAECVSCGKDIPAGKFFCDECYKSMKGRRATPRKVDAPSSAQPRKEPRASRKAKGALPASTPEAASSAVPKISSPPPAATGEKEEEVKKPSADLTPTAGKKVVSLKNKAEGVPGETSPGGKKRFKVTITFSERTYKALARLKRKENAEATPAKGEQAGIEAQPAKPKRLKRRTGPHGRPKLKAVSDSSQKKDGHENTLMKYIGHRERERDKGDRVAVLMATAATVLIIIFCFLGWVKVLWTAGEGAQAMSTTVKGVDLGAPVYAMMALVIAAWVYMAVSSLTDKTLLNLDFGFIIIMCGIFFIAIFFMAVGTSNRVMGVAAEAMGKGKDYFQTSLSSFERQNLWPAYFTVFLGVLFAFSGLVRLSERRASEEPEKESE